MINIGKYNLNQAEKLIKLARDSINSRFNNSKIECPKGPEYMQERGVFVTLTKDGQLRGCIGYPLPSLAIADAVAQAAQNAAFSDPRFRPLEKHELNNIIIEISILTVPQECSPNDIKIGRDGLICNYLGYEGLLLPQVAVEHKMDRIQFLECVCQKAGLPDDAWQKPGFKLQKFQAQIFREKEPGGEIVEVQNNGG